MDRNQQKMANAADQAVVLKAQLQQASQQLAALAQQLCAVLIDHHQGRAVVSVGTIESCAKMALNVEGRVSRDGSTMLMTVLDARTGHPLIVQSQEEGNGSAPQLAGPDGQAVVADPQMGLNMVAPEEPRCGSCGRRIGHNLDCPEYQQFRQ